MSYSVKSINLTASWLHQNKKAIVESSGEQFFNHFDQSLQKYIAETTRGTSTLKTDFVLSKELVNNANSQLIQLVVFEKFIRMLGAFMVFVILMGGFLFYNYSVYFFCGSLIVCWLFKQFHLFFLNTIPEQFIERYMTPFLNEPPTKQN